MDRLTRLTDLSSLETEADLLSLSGRTATSFHSDTTVGLGAVSGGAIMALGSLVLKGIEAVHIQKTLFSAAKTLRDSRRQQKELVLDPQTIAQLLELQR